MVGKIVKHGQGETYVDERGRVLSASEILRMAEELESLRDVLDAAKCIDGQGRGLDELRDAIKKHEGRFS